MKKIFSLIPLAILVFSLVSCNGMLDTEQHGVVPTATFYQSDEDCEEATVAVYALFKEMYGDFLGASPWRLRLELSDDIYTGGGQRGDNYNGEELNEFTFDYTNKHLSSTFSWMYKIIYASNLILNNFEADSEIKARNIVEAKVFRAFAYMELVTLWGPAPLTTTAIKDDYKIGNSTVEDLWKQIEKDLTEAISSGKLVRKKSQDDTVTGIRITQEFAKALLGKAYVYQAKWDEAVPVLDEVADSPLYGLLDSYEKYCMAPYNRNPEVLFSCVHTNDPNLRDQGGFPWGCMSHSSSYVNGLPATSLDFHWLGFSFLQPSQTIINAFLTHEPDSKRFHETLKSYADMQASGITLTSAGYYANAGYFNYKYRASRTSVVTGQAMSFYCDDVVMKLSEVILLAAEAHIMRDGAGAGDKYINRIREKAGVPAKNGCTMADLKLEKQLECYMDGTRYYDLVRWGDAETIMAEQGKHIPVFLGYKDDGSLNVKWDAYTNDNYGFKAKHKLLPFPEEEMNINPNIKQNAGW